MPSDNTVRVSLRLQPDVHKAILHLAEAKGVDPAAFMQDILEQSVFEYLPPERQREIENTKKLFSLAQKKAQELFEDGKFSSHFTLQVIRSLMDSSESRGLYEEIVGAPFDTDGAPKKTPLNMYLGWYIKNAVPVRPLLDSAGKPKRAFVKGEAIKSYTLLTI